MGFCALDSRLPAATVCTVYLVGDTAYYMSDLASLPHHLAFEHPDMGCAAREYRNSM